MNTLSPVIRIETAHATPATPSAPNLASASDSGSSNSDDITNDSTPTFEGNCNDGETMQLYMNGFATSDSAACSSSNYNVTLTGGASNGSQNFTITASDGSESSQSSSLFVTIDATSPMDPSAPDLSDSSDTGSSNSDNITNDQTPTFTGTCEGNDTVVLLRDGNPVTAGACSSNTYTIDSSTSSDGTYQFGMQFTDTAGNTTTLSPSTLSVTIDVTAPTLSENTAVTTPTNDTTPDYTFTSNEAGAITYGGGCSSGSTSTFGGSLTLTLSNLSDGTYNCTITVTDAAGNTSSTLNMSSFRTDTSAPTLAEVTPITTPTNDNTPSYTFSSDEAGTISTAGGCTTGSTSAVAGNNTISFDAMADGTYSAGCRIYVMDSLGYTSIALYISTFTINTSVPTIAEVTAISSPTADTTPDYTFSSSEAGTISYGGDCSSGTTTATVGNISITLSTLSNGTYSNCTITVTDAAGNASSSLTITSFTVATGGGAPSAPSAPNLASGSDSGSSSTDDITNDTTPTLEGACTDGHTMKIYVDAGATSDTAVCASSAYSITLSTPLSSGTYSITTTANNGSESSQSSALSITIDTSAPVATGTPDLDAGSDTGASSTDNTTTDTTPTFTISCVSGTTVQLMANGTTSGSSGTCSSSTISLTTGTLSDGTFTITAKQTDTAGNESSGSAGLSITIDTSTPSSNSSSSTAEPTEHEEARGGGHRGSRTSSDHINTTPVQQYPDTKPAAPTLQQENEPEPRTSIALQTLCTAPPPILTERIYIRNHFYSDVRPSDWYAQAVLRLTRSGIVKNDVTSNTYNPSETVPFREAMTVSIYTRLANTSAADTHDAHPIIRALSQSITHRQNAEVITRGEMIHLLTQSFCLSDSPEELPYNDVSVHHRYAADIAKATALGIVSGDGNTRTTFRPDAPLTRAEMAAMILRAVEISPLDQ